MERFDEMSKTLITDNRGDATNIVLCNADSTIPGSPMFPTIDGYDIIQELGKGSMGVVYAARQIVASRRVALKVITPEAHMQKRLFERFGREIAAIARLTHPAIVQLYDAGPCDRGWHFSMELVEGQSLQDALDAGQRYNDLEIARMVSAIARAMHYAHVKGVVHRDLKPANILVGDGSVPKIADFGLARIDDSAIQTNTGDVVGTPLYMSPEQAAGKAHLVGPTSDIYSLGAMLYRLIAGEVPIDRGSTLPTLHAVIGEEPIIPSKRADRPVSKDLETICMKCLQKEPSKRYATMDALADDLDRYIVGDPILARPIGRVERLVRWSKRNQMLTVSCMVALLFASLAGISHVMRWYDAHKASVREIVRERQLQQETIKRKEVETQIEQAQYEKLISTIVQTAHTKPSDAQALLKEVPRAFLPRWEVAYLQRLCRNDLRMYEGHVGPVWDVAWSPDGTLIASVASGKNTLCVWNPNTGATVCQLSGVDTGDARCVVFISNNLIAVGSSSGDIRIISLSGSTSQVFSVGQGLLSLAASHNGRYLAAGGVTGTAVVWEVAFPERPTMFQHDVPVTSVAFNSDATKLFCGGGDRITAFNVSTQAVVRSVTHTGTVRSIAVADSGDVVFSGDDRGVVTAWDFQKGEKLFSYSGHTGPVSSIALSADGAKGISAGRDGMLRIWSAATGQELYTLSGHLGEVMAVRPAGSGTMVASASYDHTVRLWDVATGGEHLLLQGHTGTITCVAAHPSLPFVASGSFDTTIVVWNEKGQQVRKFDHGVPIAAIQFTPDGSHLVSSANDGSVRVWELGSGQCVATTMHGSAVRAVGLHPSGQYMVSGGSDGVVRIWNLLSGSSVALTRIPNVRIWSLCYLSDASIVFGTDTGNIFNWSGKQGEDATLLYSHTAPVQALVPKGSFLFSAGTDGVVAWDLITKSRSKDFHPASLVVSALGVTHDGTRLFVGNVMGNIKVVDAKHGKEVLTLPNTKGATALTLFPNGNLFFCGQDSILRGIVLNR